jgi:hypothetical protein
MFREKQEWQASSRYGRRLFNPELYAKGPALANASCLGVSRRMGSATQKNQDQKEDNAL